MTTIARGPVVTLTISVALALAACAPEPSGALADRLAEMGATSCADNPDFDCVDFPVPLDPDHPEGPSIDVRFAVRLARGVAAQGVLLTVAGGPGYSGVASSEVYDEIDPAIQDDFDLIFFDLRGVRGSGNFDCVAAAGAYYRDGLRAASADEDRAIAARAARFADDCVAEIGVPPAELAHYTTANAVRDVEAFRAALGVDAMTLYGYSYGTQLVQTYAERFPARVRAMILDGVVDLTLSDVDFAADLVRSSNEVLGRVLDACAADAACGASLGGDPAGALDGLIARLTVAPVAVAYPLTSGRVVERSFGVSDLDAVTAWEMDNPAGRGEWLRALAAATGATPDLVPMLRILYQSVDEETLGIVADPSWSDAIYYTVTCNDYGHPAGSAAARQASWLARGADLRADPTQRILSPFYGDLPCMTWPGGPPLVARPPPFVPTVPTLFIDADGDTSTPFDQGQGMVQALTAAGAPVAAVTVAGGHHVMLGVGNACVDQVGARFLREPRGDGVDTWCDGGLVDLAP